MSGDNAMLAAPLVLPEDVLVFSVSELAPEITERSAFDPKNFVITRKNARLPSKVVDADAAALIEVFRKPRTIVEGVLAFSSDRRLDPRRVLDEAFPMLGEFLSAGILVLASSTFAESIQLSLAVGDVIGGARVEAPIQLMEDTEVYRVVSENGSQAALKMARAGHEARVGRALAREAALLARLQGCAAPSLFEEGTHAGRPYLLLEWCEGQPALAAARQLQSPIAMERSPRLLALCVAVLRAYATLHAHGIVHGDVHPNNVLVTEEGAVRLVDFGLGRVLYDSDWLAAPPRGGAAFYFDPASAAAMRAKRPPPAVDPSSEQYSLAVLLREMLVGRPYLDFSVEHDELLRQIVEESPVPFIRHGAPPWADVELALSRALAKDPERRFASVADFADTLERAAPGEAVAIRGLSMPSLLDAVLDRLRPDGAAFRALDDPAPLCSVNIGAAGAAYALYRVANSRQEAETLALAELWITRAERHADNPAAFYSRELDITPDSVGSASLFHSPVGVACVHALICAALGDEAGTARAVERFIVRSRTPCDRIDLTLGCAGILLGAAALLAALPKEIEAPRSSLHALGGQVANNLCATLLGLPPVGKGDVLNLGVAHGWGGVLFALLRWQETTGWSKANPLITTRLGELAEEAKTAGTGLCWPWLSESPGTDAAMPGWCNGSAGLVHLWTLAERTLHRENYGKLASLAAMNAWEEPRNIGDLCCGAAGRAYAMLDLYRHTGDGVWLDRARSLGEDAARVISRWSLRRDSLYKGEVGVALLLADLQRPELSCMPLFDREP
jgi:hypothetical protein